MSARMKRMGRSWQRFFLQGDFALLLIATVILVMPVLSLDAAGWPLAMRTTIPVLVMSVAFGFILARSQYNEFLALIISGLYGFGVVLVVAGFNEPGNVLQGMVDVIVRTIRWSIDAFVGGINQDNLVFTLLVSLLFWFLGYNAIWHMFRLDRVWRVILPPGLILITNMIVYSGDVSLEIYLIVYIFFSLILVVRSNLEDRQWEWYVNGIRVPQQIRRQFLSVGAVFAMITLLIAWAIPTNNVQESLDRFQTFLQADPIQQFSEIWNRLFAPIESEGPATTDYYGGDLLNLGGAIRLGEQVVLLVEAPNVGHRYYWRSRVFERYEEGQWSPSASLRVTDTNLPLDVKQNEQTLGLARQPIEQRFTIGTNSSRLYHVAQQPDIVNATGQIDLSYIDEPANNLMNISVMRPLQVLRRGDTYTATSQLSVATADQLRSAPTNYPEWVTGANLYVGNVSGRVLQLARDIVTEAGATNPYDQAKAIETWLRENITYDETITAPPPNVDPIDWTLFESRRGYCTYYATSMIVMLRSLGIPSRMAAGFSQGEYDASTGQYVVQERDAHTWVEVFFPGYGWIEFEPTAAEAPLNRDGDNLGDNTPQQSVPIPTLTPTPTFTPTFVPSPTPQVTPNQQQPDNAPQPTITLTPSPSPTATPVVVPTVQPPIEPRSESLLSFLLPAVGAALVIVTLIILFALILLLLYWWWEWRGMGGLSPVARAYARLERYVSLIGIRTRKEQTPAEKGKQIASKVPSAQRPVNAITKMYTEERYRGNQDSVQRAQNMQSSDVAWSHARKNILKRYLRRFIPFLRD